MPLRLKDWVSIGISAFFGAVRLINELRNTNKYQCATDPMEKIIEPANEPVNDVQEKKITFTLKRTYYHNGTNGQLKTPEKVYNTIELPWRDNLQRISCIPEGVYKLVKRHSPRFDQHLHLPNVEGREFILIHPANSALDELAGCIALVTDHTGPGMGTRSGIPTNEFRLYVYDLIDQGYEVYLSIKASTPWADVENRYKV